jgi:3-hydroxyisobutyrate dehydrogenase-like beta-hydroxyacid dehydrogenase
LVLLIRLAGMKLTILGLGEEASTIARQIVKQGVDVVAYDPAKPKNAVVPLIDSAVAAVAEADVIFSLNSANSSIQLAKQVAPHIKPGAIFCDLNNGTPSLKSRLAEIVPAGLFVDAAILKTSDGSGDKVAIDISGEGAKQMVTLFDGLNLQINYVSDVPGEAAARQQIRSMLKKGMAAVAIDALWAAKSVGLQDWAIEEIKNEFEISSSQTAQRHLDDTQQHPKRHSVEMADVVEMLSEAGHESTMVRGIELTLSRVIHGVRVPFAELD